MATIVPCITVSTPEDYKASLERVHLFAQRIHVDVSDGVFAPITLLEPTQIWWPQEWTVDVHAMVSQPSLYVPQLIALKPSLITLHVETDEDIVPLLQQEAEGAPRHFDQPLLEQADAVIADRFGGRRHPRRSIIAHREPPVEHPVDGRHTDACGARKVGNGGPLDQSFLSPASRRRAR